MSSAVDMKCPICKTSLPMGGLPSISCKQCSFNYAFVRYFAGNGSQILFQEKLKEAKHKYLLSMIERHSNTNRFTLTGDSVAYISEKKSVLGIIKGNGSIENISDVKQYSASERNSAILYKNGRIKVTGDNSYGQCAVQELKDISFILCAPNCIYAVNKAGEVSIVGAIIDHNIRKWRKIKSLVCGSYHVLGLTTDNTVKIAGDMLDDGVIETVLKWKNVKSVAAATDCSVALFQDGTVGFAGRKSDLRKEVETWKNIVSVDVDSSYAIGITEEGRVKMAGSCKAFLDMGRASVKNLDNVIAVSCSRSGIAVILNDGTLKITGNISGDADDICTLWKKHIII